MFNGCDYFNRHFKDKKFPHRCGGGLRSGQTGHVHKFLMSCLVQNVFNAYKSINNDESKSNKAMCIELSDALYIYSQEFYDFGN